MPALSTKTKPRYRELIRSVLAEKPQTSIGGITQLFEPPGLFSTAITSESMSVRSRAPGLDSKWIPRDLFRAVEARQHFGNSMFCWGLFWWT